MLDADDDQFNGLHEALVARFQALFAAESDVHFTAHSGRAEDYATVEAMGWAAREAGLPILLNNLAFQRGHLTPQCPDLLIKPLMLAADMG